MLPSTTYSSNYDTTRMYSMVPTGVERRWARNGIQTQPTKHGENLAMNQFFSYDMCSAKHLGGGGVPEKMPPGRGPVA